MDSDEACSAGYQDVVHQLQLSSPISLLFRAILISKKFVCARVVVASTPLFCNSACFLLLFSNSF